MPRWVLAQELLQGRPRKADTFCLTAALSRPTAWGNQHSKWFTNPKHSFSWPRVFESISLRGCFPQGREMAPVAQDTHSPPGVKDPTDAHRSQCLRCLSIIRCLKCLRQSFILKKQQKGLLSSPPKQLQFSVSSYSGRFLPSPPRFQVFWNLGRSCLEQRDFADGPVLKSFLLIFPQTTNPPVRRASLLSHPFTPDTGQLPGPPLWTRGEVWDKGLAFTEGTLKTRAEGLGTDTGRREAGTNEQGHSPYSCVQLPTTWRTRLRVPKSGFRLGVLE